MIWVAGQDVVCVIDKKCTSRKKIGANSANLDNNHVALLSGRDIAGPEASCIALELEAMSSSTHTCQLVAISNPVVGGQIRSKCAATASELASLFLDISFSPVSNTSRRPHRRLAHMLSWMRRAFTDDRAE